MSCPKAENIKMKKRQPERSCAMCGTKKGMMRKYGMKICRRCFKDNATRMGFVKYD
jgi:ribosomal protein S14